MQFNPGNMINDFDKHHSELRNFPDQVLNHRTIVGDDNVENQLQTLMHFSAWLREQKHEYIIFNYADNSYPKIVNQNPYYYDKFINDNGFIKFDNFRMNTWLYTNGVESDPRDEKINPLYRHPVVDNNLRDTMSKFLIDYYEENLK